MDNAEYLSIAEDFAISFAKSKDSKNREWCKKMYQHMTEIWVSSPEGKKIIGYEKANPNTGLDTYPKPYRLTKFATWDSKGRIVDQSGCIIKTDTSYVCWKIRETIGSWPNNTVGLKPSIRTIENLLAENGYNRIAKRPTKKHYFVGIPKDAYLSVKETENNPALVVWFEHETSDSRQVRVSTYTDKHYKFWFVKVDDYKWITID